MIGRSFAIFLLAAPVAAGASQPGGQTCGGPLPNWAARKVVPNQSKARPLNVVAVGDRGQLTWNGKAVTGRQVSHFIGLVVASPPGDVTELVVRPGADCVAVERTRKMIDDGLRCRPGSCVEVAL